MIYKYKTSQFMLIYIFPNIQIFINSFILGSNNGLPTLFHNKGNVPLMYGAKRGGAKY